MIRNLWDCFMKSPFEVGIKWHSGPEVADSLDYSNILDSVSPAKIL